MKLLNILCYSAMVILCCAVHANAQANLTQQMTELGQQVSAKAVSKQKTSVAVIDFADLNGNISDAGRFLAEELVMRLYETGKIKVIERQRTSRFIREQKINLLDGIDVALAKQIGKGLGVDAVVSGTVTDLGKTLRLNIRIVSTDTGEVVAVVASEINQDESLTRLLSQGTTSQAPSGPTPLTDNIVGNKPSDQKLVANEFAFELSSCRRTGNNLSCSFTVTNLAAIDRILVFISVVMVIRRRELSMIWATNTFRLKGTLGQKACKDCYCGCSVDFKLVPRIGTRGTIVFETLASNATSLKLIRFVCNVRSEGRSEEFNVDFRDVAIAK